MNKDFDIRIYSQPQIRAKFANDFCLGQEAEFIHHIRCCIDSEEVLKDDTKARLIKISYNAMPVVIKHYRYVGSFHALAHTLTCSRASYAWNVSLKFRKMAIPTPEALACIECYNKGLLDTSYFVYGFADGFRFREYAWARTPDVIMQEKHVHHVYALLKRLRRLKISHGDLKMPNILITEDGPVLIDLDQVRFHRFRPIFAKRRLRDLRRFRKELPWNRR